MIVPVVVEGQSLRWYGRIPEIADNSIEFVQLEFRFPGDWDNMVIVAQFTQTKTYNCLLVNNRCFLPMELVAGPCEVSVFGYLNEEMTRGTTIPLKLNISRSGFVSSAETPIPPTPDLYAQLIEYFSSISGSGGGDSSAFYIAISEENGSYVMDKTFPELKEAHEAGRPVYAIVNVTVENLRVNNAIFQFSNVFDAFFVFTHIENSILFTAFVNKDGISFRVKDMLKKVPSPTNCPIPMH